MEDRQPLTVAPSSTVNAKPPKFVRFASAPFDARRTRSLDDPATAHSLAAIEAALDARSKLCNDAVAFEPRAIGIGAMLDQAISPPTRIPDRALRGALDLEIVGVEKVAGPRERVEANRPGDARTQLERSNRQT